MNQPVDRRGRGHRILEDRFPLRKRQVGREQLAAVAVANGLTASEILLWIHDRPRHEMSAAHFVRWCGRYGFLPLMPAPSLTVEELQRRIVAYARQAVARGVVSENRLAILVGISQPHLHHILKGKRACSAATADAIVRALGVHGFDLYTLEELRELIDAAIANTRARVHAELEVLGRERGQYAGIAGSNLSARGNVYDQETPYNAQICANPVHKSYSRTG